MWLTELAVRRPVLTMVFAMLLTVAGMMSLRQLPVREYPDIAAPVISIATSYPGAAAAVVDSQITEVLEGAVSGIEGVRSISSSSSNGRSSINIEFGLDRDVNEAGNDVRDRVGRVLSQLPDEADPPRIAKQDSDARAILYISLFGTSMSPMELTDYAERYIVEQFAIVPGVSNVPVYGNGRPSMRVWLDRRALAARNLTVADVEAALRRENIELPGGFLESTDREFPIRIDRGYSTPDEFRRLVVGRGDDGHLIRLGEFARIELGSRDQRSVFRTNGENMVALGIVKQTKANTVDVIDGVDETLERVNDQLPDGMKMVKSTDDSVFIRAAVGTVYRTIAITTVLVGLVILGFLTAWRATVIPMITIPVCLIATCSALALFGFSINLITLLALVLCIGLVVDDAIVVLENVYRRIQDGEPALLAANRGTKQVVFAVVATTAVLVAVFLPIVFLTDSIGRIFSELAVTICAALVLSSLLALTLVPMLCSKLLKGHGAQLRRENLVNRVSARATAKYRIWLSRCLQLRAVWVLITIGFAVAAGWLIQTVDRELTPQEDRGMIVASFRAPEGSSLEYMREQIPSLEAPPLKLLADGIVTRALLRVPGFFGGNSVNSGILVLNLALWDQREPSTQDVIDGLNRDWASLKNLKLFAFSHSGIGHGVGRPVEFVLGGTNYEQLAQWRDELLARARENPGLLRVDFDLRETQPQLIVEIDTARAATLGVSAEAIGRELQALMSDQTLTTYQVDGEEYDVVLQAEDDQRMTPADLLNVYVRSATMGKLVPLSNLVTTKELAAPGELLRYNRLRAVTITAGLAPGYSLGEALDFLEETTRDILPATAQIGYKGESREYIDASGSLYLTFGLALLIVFLVLAAQFESFLQPLVIMCTVPLAIAGGLVGLVISDTTLNIYSQIGLLMLIGIATKNGILIVEFINQVRDRGVTDVNAAIVEASAMRLRPVLMTTASTVMGSVPLMLATGPGSEGLSALGVVIFWGLLIAVVLTLFVVPVLYSLIGRYTGSPGAVGAELDALEKAS